jgi:putative membrane protein
MSSEKVLIPNDRRAAEYLANERTFLAWIRTAIAVLSLGFALAKFSVWMHDLTKELGRPVRGEGASVPMGESLMALGGVLAVLAAWRFLKVYAALEQVQV